MGGLERFQAVLHVASFTGKRAGKPKLRAYAVWLRQFAGGASHNEILWLQVGLACLYRLRHAVHGFPSQLSKQRSMPNSSRLTTVTKGLSSLLQTDLVQKLPRVVAFKIEDSMSTALHSTEGLLGRAPFPAPSDKRLGVQGAAQEKRCSCPAIPLSGRVTYCSCCAACFKCC